jgi:hypothetical protein
MVIGMRIEFFPASKITNDVKKVMNPDFHNSSFFIGVGKQSILYSTFWPQKGGFKRGSSLFF